MIPRPERTPGALRAACTVVAPGLLSAYDQAKDQARAEAVEHGSLKPVHACLSHWATLLEIERHPATAASTTARSTSPGSPARRTRRVSISGRPARCTAPPPRRCARSDVALGVGARRRLLRDGTSGG
ncbi:DUF6247 family protein [Streptomyces sp. SudanB66_2053]|uniref:DUF6247 family protein n=1 Tax=Streptomyces sp. SudanB66_2053 TaxID=3035277 RepID=UPI003F560F05